MNSIRQGALDSAMATRTEPCMGKSSQSTLNLRQNESKSSYTTLSRADGSLTATGE